ncbi:DUF1488 domain-containing protein [Ancylobacter sp. VKM B-3255]|uniref:DUF1488 domain-containing protein n=2 Tax=Ancylobacter radicis TaxID=2836179 RepID=A0ABS5R5V2_9HYPH|nr:DUF1488 domain-containing protein [Ancylobacter radicis]
MTDPHSPPTSGQLDAAKPHSAMPPDDLPESRAIRFHFRGDHDLIECWVSWEALERLEGGPADSSSDRLARFEQHRPRIEAAALRKIGRAGGAGAPLRIDAEDILNAPQA